jgi:hypothetical protein
MKQVKSGRQMVNAAFSLFVLNRGNVIAIAFFCDAASYRGGS